MNENVFFEFSKHIHILEPEMKRIGVQWIIHIFAALHVVTTVSCRMAGVNDELLLTLLTMTMVVLVCLKRNLTLEFTAAIVILVNVIGYVLGTGCADFISMFFDSRIAVHGISTFLTTEILGWGGAFAGRMLYKRQPAAEQGWSVRVVWLIVTVVAIFLFRILILALERLNVFSDGMMYNMFLVFMSNLPVIIIILCINIIYVRYLRLRHSVATLSFRLLSLTSFVFFTVLSGTFMLGYGIPFSFGRIAGWQGMLSLAFVVFISEVVIYVLTYMFDYMWASRQALSAEKMKRHKAQFEYLKLKQQVDPHFLFNSLNVLDCLVMENKAEEASTFIHKLAGMYRYMLKNEASVTICLREEMAFVNMYADLMKVRFQSGFVLHVDIPESVMGKLVIPCSLQMLLENALKHNAARPSDPLVISIVASDDEIRVSNTLHPRQSGADTVSTHVGLNYIRQQYMDLMDRNITISEEDGEYSVILPLITSAS